MVNAVFRKSLILVVLTLVFSHQSFWQKKGKLKEFTKTFPEFIIELNEFMTAFDNTDLKSVFKLFSKNAETFTEVEQVSIIAVSNKMLEKQLRANPYFSKFLSFNLIQINIYILNFLWYCNFVKILPTKIAISTNAQLWNF